MRRRLLLPVFASSLALALLVPMPAALAVDRELSVADDSGDLETLALPFLGAGSDPNEHPDASAVDFASLTLDTTRDTTVIEATFGSDIAIGGDDNTLLFWGVGIVASDFTVAGFGAMAAEGEMFRSDEVPGEGFSIGERCAAEGLADEYELTIDGATLRAEFPAACLPTLDGDSVVVGLSGLFAESEDDFTFGIDSAVGLPLSDDDRDFEPVDVIAGSRSLEYPTRDTWDGFLEDGETPPYDARADVTEATLDVGEDTIVATVDHAAALTTSSDLQSHVYSLTLADATGWTYGFSAVQDGDTFVTRDYLLPFGVGPLSYLAAPFSPRACARVEDRESTSADQAEITMVGSQLRVEIPTRCLKGGHGEIVMAHGASLLSPDPRAKDSVLGYDTHANGAVLYFDGSGSAGYGGTGNARAFTADAAGDVRGAASFGGEHYSRTDIRTLRSGYVPPSAGVAGHLDLEVTTAAPVMESDADYVDLTVTFIGREVDLRGLGELANLEQTLTFSFGSFDPETCADPDGNRYRMRDWIVDGAYRMRIPGPCLPDDLSDSLVQAATVGLDLETASIGTDAVTARLVSGSESFGPVVYPIATARDTTDTCGDRPTSFADVRGNAHAAAIACIESYGITNGKTDGTYGVADGLTVAQIATFLVRTLEAASVNVGEPDDDFGFSADCSAGVHTRALRILIDAYILPAEACADPTRQVDRAEMAEYTVGALARFLSYDALPYFVDEDYFDDDEDLGFDQGDINVAANVGIVTGKGGAVYGPDDRLRRDQMATFLARALDIARADDWGEGFEQDDSMSDGSMEEGSVQEQPASEEPNSDQGEGQPLPLEPRTEQSAQAPAWVAAFCDVVDC